MKVYFDEAENLVVQAETVTEILAIREWRRKDFEILIKEKP